jgi:hypothetical protein
MSASMLIIWKLDLQPPMQSVSITTKVVNSNPFQGEVYSIQHYVIKLVSDLRHVGGFLGYSCFLRHDITEILLKVALNTINQTIFFELLCRNYQTIQLERRVFN